jgi:hypothetical protein
MVEDATTYDNTYKLDFPFTPVVHFKQFNYIEISPYPEERPHSESYVLLLLT